MFVETRLQKLLETGEVEAKVIAPVPWFPSQAERFGAYALLAATPLREVRHGVEVFHPRYLLPPRVGMTVAPFSLARGAWSSVRNLLDQGWGFDVIDAHYFYPDGVAAARLAAKTGRPFVATARGSDLNVIGDHDVPRRLMVRAAQRAACSVAVCDALAQRLISWGVSSDRVRVLRNGVDLHRFRPHPRDASREELRIDGSPLLLSVGNLVEVKGHDLTLRALALLRGQCPAAHLVIVGAGALRSELQRQAHELGVGDAVTFAGSQPQDSLPRWYSAADVLVLASRSEGWANVLLEAMACGTPVVATAVGGSPEVVSASVAGRLVLDHEPRSLADAVFGLLRSERPAREAVRGHAEQFSWDETTKGQLEVFAQALTSHIGEGSNALLGTSGAVRGR